MRTIAIFAAWCLTSVAVQVPAGLCSAQVQMDWRLPEGTRWDVDVGQSIRTETQSGERLDAISMETAMEMQWAVDRVDADGAMHLTQIYRRFRLKSSTLDAEPITYDSRSTEDPADELKPIARLMRPLIGMRYLVVLSRRGEIASVELPSETESLLGNLPTMSQWKKMLTKDGIDHVLRQSLGVLPESPVKVGDRWTSMQQVDSPLGALAIETTYRYEGIQRREQRTLQHIRAVMQTAVTDENPAIPLADKLQPKQQAVYYFDTAQGCLAESHLRQTVSSEVLYGVAKIGVKSVGTVTLRINPSERE